MATHDRPDFEELDRIRQAVEASERPEAINAAADDLKTELEHRAYLWTYLQKHAPVGMSIETPSESSQRVPSFFSLTRYYLAGLCITVSGIAFLAVSQTAGIAMAATGLGALVAWQLHANRCRARLLSSQTCLKCGYDLTSLPDAVNAAAIRGLRLGPLRCPDCGREWPVVPTRDGRA